MPIEIKFNEKEIRNLSVKVAQEYTPFFKKQNKKTKKAKTKTKKQVETNYSYF